MTDRHEGRPSPVPGEPIGGPDWWAEVRERAQAWSSDGSSALSSASGIKAWWEATLAEKSSADPPGVAPPGVGRLSSVNGGEPPADGSAEPAQEASAGPPTSAENATENATATQAPTGPATPAESTAGLVAVLVDAASALALAEPPEVASACLAEAQELIYARDRLASAIAGRVDRVHRTGEARGHGHTSTQAWLRSGCGTGAGSASHVVMLGTQLARLPVVRARFADGSLAEGQVSAICIAVKKLTDEQAAIAEPILVELADNATPDDVAKAGRYLRYLLDPDGPRKGDDEDEKDYRKRFLEVRPTDAGGMEGEFRLPKESAARLKALLDAYAKPRSENDDRSLRQRNADVLADFLANKITTELLVLVNAESLPSDQPTPDHDTHGDDGTGGTGGTEDTGGVA
ncbi:DUF222 domain-containing protein, partial [Planotetraspora thailandica]|uniref:DUF222 domain-containing protein n=1 Tax=Planotetraspora thailandica TaxID=487172 RepID=UPI0035ED2F5C